LALQMFLELGFGTVAVQMVAHEAAHLEIDLKSGVTGPVLYLERFSATVRFIKNWYTVLSLLVGVVLFPVGFWFFSTSGSGSSATWLGPWAIIVLAASGSMFVNILGAVIAGMGFVAESIRVRLWGGAAQIFLSIAGLLAGLGLYSVPIASMVALVINFALVWQLLHHVIRETSGHGKETHIDWVKEILPFQWRIALTWASGWFIFSAMLPVVFRQLGPEEAGRFGLAMSIFTFIGTLGTSWSSTKSAIWGQMVSKKDWKSMDALFWQVMPQSAGIAVFASLTALLTLPHLVQWLPRFAGRVPEWRVLLMLCLVAVMNQIVYAEACYLRAHKREPFLISSFFLAVGMAIGLFGFSYSSVFPISVMYATLSLFGSLIWGSVIFIRCRASWHRLETAGFDPEIASSATKEF
jgi:hypothetical protein